jgi:hypothetical protein
MSKPVIHKVWKLPSGRAEIELSPLFGGSVNVNDEWDTIVFEFSDVDAAIAALTEIKAMREAKP